ncbi:MAG: hypothetical protein WJ306_08775 [Ferrovum myxofaciens]
MSASQGIHGALGHQATLLRLDGLFCLRQSFSGCRQIVVVFKGAMDQGTERFIGKYASPLGFDLFAKDPVLCRFFPFFGRSIVIGGSKFGRDKIRTYGAGRQTNG